MSPVCVLCVGWGEERGREANPNNLVRLLTCVYVRGLLKMHTQTVSPPSLPPPPHPPFSLSTHRIKSLDLVCMKELEKKVCTTACSLAQQGLVGYKT